MKTEAIAGRRNMRECIAQSTAAAWNAKAANEQQIVEPGLTGHDCKEGNKGPQLRSPYFHPDLSRSLNAFHKQILWHFHGRLASLGL
jgi:hypothetical protein